MSGRFYRNLFLSFTLSFASLVTNAQNSYLPVRDISFKMQTALAIRQDSLEKEFKAKGLEWPAKYVFIRSFKYDGQLEVWVKNEPKEKYKLFKTYRVCLLSGAMGPKRMQGDYQVPEGFYYINEFNPRSNYHLALGLNYPNASDKILSDSLRPGNGIYIHGSCVSVGCIPVTDDDIEEIYLIASSAKASGEDFIPVHVFPVRYNRKKSFEFFENYSRNNPSLEKFGLQLKAAYDKFEATKEVPLVMVDRKGDYVID
ncbi:MAG TPA: L,D-transpeptidase family protein [Hanamia sp.]|jgi:murein L,D-transpeptidase YafK|nr:L,D-transpeptidase family protein [Hanamia sp.]